MNAPAKKGRGLANNLMISTGHVASDDVHTQLAYHNTEALRLKYMYNASSLLAKLPTHVLAIIFLEHTTGFYENHLKWWHCREDCFGMQSPAHKELSEWIYVAHVCRRWRAVALDFAPLWTTLVFDDRIHPDFLRTIIPRSRGLPLNIVLHVSRGRHCGGCLPPDGRVENFGESIDILKQVLPRARELSIFSAQDDDAMVSYALEELGCAFNLEHLCIEGLRSENFRGQDALVQFPDEADVVTVGLHPSLNSLRISRVWFDSRWSYVFFGPTLRHLDISCSESLNECMDMNALLLALSRIPFLESFKLDSLPRLSSRGNRPAQEEYRLPRLRKLQLRMMDEGVPDFLTRLELPQTTSVRFFAEPSDLPRDVEDRADIPESVIKGLTRASVQLLQGAFPYAIFHRGRPSEWWRRETEKAPQTAIWAADTSALTGSPLLSVHPWKTASATPYRLEFAAHLDDALMSAILAAIDLRHLRTASIWDTAMSNDRSLVESLQRAENLATLCLQRHVSYGAGAFIAGWRRPGSGAADADDDPPARRQVLDRWGLGRDFSTVGTGAGGTPPRPLFPRLHTLEFVEVDLPLSSLPTMRYKFGEEIGYWFSPLPRNYPQEMEYGLDVPGLVESLRGRSAQGAATVARVVFDKCQCYERERLAPLVGVVDEVLWDGTRVAVEDLAVALAGPSQASSRRSERLASGQ